MALVSFADSIGLVHPEFGWRPLNDIDTAYDDPRLMADPNASSDLPPHRRGLPPRTCFVTVGATASFRALVAEVLSSPFLEQLSNMGFTELIVQCGPDMKFFEENCPTPGYDSHWLVIKGFDLTNDMPTYMRKACPGPSEQGERVMGVIISHAGAGTILDALRLNTKMITVPNSSLMDDHQTELAAELDKQGYLTWGRIGSLADALRLTETHPPVNWPPQPPVDAKYKGGLWEVIGETTARSKRSGRGEVRKENDTMMRVD